MAAMKQRVKNLKGSEYFPYPLYRETEREREREALIQIKLFCIRGVESRIIQKFIFYGNLVFNIAVCFNVL